MSTNSIWMTQGDTGTIIPRFTRIKIPVTKYSEMCSRPMFELSKRTSKLFIYITGLGSKAASIHALLSDFYRSFLHLKKKLLREIFLILHGLSRLIRTAVHVVVWHLLYCFTFSWEIVKPSEDSLQWTSIPDDGPSRAQQSNGGLENLPNSNPGLQVHTQYSVATNEPLLLPISYHCSQWTTTSSNEPPPLPVSHHHPQ